MQLTEISGTGERVTKIEETGGIPEAAVGLTMLTDDSVHVVSGPESGLPVSGAGGASV